MMLFTCNGPNDVYLDLIKQHSVIETTMLGQFCADIFCMAGSNGGGGSKGS